MASISSLDVPPLLMVEGAYKYNQKSALPAPSSSAAGIISAPSRTSASIPAARSIAVTGNPGKPLDNDWGIYGIIDQLVWRVPGSEDPKGVGVFARVIGAPIDRNLVDFYADGGITFTGMIPGASRRCARHRLRLYRHLRSGARLR